MNPVDIENCLGSMSILYDTREHPTKQAEKRYKSFGCPAIRQHISYGDYTYQFVLPNGQPFYETGEDVTVEPPVSIERKANLTELSGNIIQGRDTFEREFTRAREKNARVYLLVEEGTAEKMYNGGYLTKVHPNAYTAAVWSLVARYHLSGPIFCRKETSGKVIHDILYRELKERLEAGFYDEYIRDS